MNIIIEEKIEELINVANGINGFEPDVLILNEFTLKKFQTELEERYPVNIDLIKPLTYRGLKIRVEESCPDYYFIISVEDNINEV